MTVQVDFAYSHTVGFLANQGRGFNNPVDVAWDSAGVLYVVNRAGPEVGIRLPYKRVTICTVDQEYLGEFGTGGQGDGEFWWPSSLAFDSEDQLYVADEALHRISIFDRQGQFLGKWGTGGSEEGQLNRVSSIAFDSEENLLVSDSLNHRIQKFTKDGRFLASWGEPGAGTRSVQHALGSLPGRPGTTFTWPTGATIASKSSTQTGNSSGNGAVPATEKGSSTARRPWRWTRSRTFTWRIGAMSESRF